MKTVLKLLYLNFNLSEGFFYARQYQTNSGSPAAMQQLLLYDHVYVYA